MNAKIGSGGSRKKILQHLQDKTKLSNYLETCLEGMSQSMDLKSLKIPLGIVLNKITEALSQKNKDAFTARNIYAITMISKDLKLSNLTKFRATLE